MRVPVWPNFSNFFKFAYLHHPAPHHGVEYEYPGLPS